MPANYLIKLKSYFNNKGKRIKKKELTESKNYNLFNYID